MSETGPIDSAKGRIQPKDAIHSDGAGVTIKKMKPYIDSLEAYLINALKNPTKKFSNTKLFTVKRNLLLFNNKINLIICVMIKITKIIKCKLEFAKNTIKYS